MDAALKELLQYGVLGVMLALSLWYILRKDTAHKEVLDNHEKTILEIVNRHENERQEWNKSIGEMYQTLIETQKEGRISMEANTRVMAELAEIIKNRIPR